MNFKRDNDKNKRLYYQLFVLVEFIILISLYFFHIHWFVLLLVTPACLIDAWSNIRCANRQKKYIKEIRISEQGITCLLANKQLEVLSLDKCLFSIREVKFEKDQTEIEIRQKRRLKSRLIGRIHISNWKQIFDIKTELIKHRITQIKYRPEGYWSKYGTLTADIVITGAAFAAGEIPGMTGDSKAAMNFKQVFMPLHDIKDTFSNNEDKTT